MEKPTSDHVIVLMEDHQNHKNHSITESQPKTNLSTEAKPPPTAQNLRRLSFSKPKARFVEFSHPVNQKFVSEPEFEPLNASDDSDEESSEDDEEYDEEGHRMQKPKKKKKFKIKWRILVEWTLFVLISTSLICSLTISTLKNQLKYGLELWRWCLMILVTFSGRLVSEWIIKIVVFFIERNFMLREKVLYFVYGLRKSIQNCVWLGLVLLSWMFIFNAKLHKKNKLLEKVFQALVAVLIGATIWLVKIILVKVLASSFHVTTYFDRMKESVFHHYVLDTLSGPPMDEFAYQEAHSRNLGVSKSLPTKLRDSRVCPSQRD
ncbi:UNVERIFIED_CONTAM: Mechanosensitive ion channel protein 5 [Sesamum latifolium]|uniref:Mechanosensitive ion channel protein 5 n=1 Tax=Sesamum latifolium TaxID=2727402 RepID=A0AAW2SMM6_9LAMI